MDPTRFDDVIRSLSIRAVRRGVLGGLTAGLLATLPLALAPDKAVAKKKKGGKGKKKKKKSAIVSPPPVPPAAVPPPPTPLQPVPNKQFKDLCTPGVDICASPYQCDTPTTRTNCNSTVEDIDTWCCIPPNGACEPGQCFCCGDNYCGGDGRCIENPDND